jgi:exosortase
MMVGRAAPPPSSPSGVRPLIWFAAAIVTIVAASLYASTIFGLAQQWYTDPNAAYGGIVAIAAAVIAARRWRSLAALPPTGSWWGAFGLCAAALVYAVGTLAADVFLLRLSLIAFLIATVWFAFGAAYLRMLAAPFMLLLVAIPLPSALVTELTLPLQLAASRCAEGLLQLAGVAVARDGNVLTLNYITLEVAEACSGMRSLVTLTALIAVYAATSEASVRRTVFLLIAAVPVAIAGNGLRVAFTGLLAARLGESAATGIVHDATGWVAFVLMCGAIVAVHAAVSRSARLTEHAI